MAVAAVRSRPAQQRSWLQLVSILPGASVALVGTPSLRKTGMRLSVLLYILWVNGSQVYVARKSTQVKRYDCCASRASCASCVSCTYILPICCMILLLCVRYLLHEVLGIYLLYLVYVVYPEHIVYSMYDVVRGANFWPGSDYCARHRVCSTTQMVFLCFKIRAFFSQLPITLTLSCTL